MPKTEDVRITNEHLSRLPIDLKQGGQFTEPLCNLIPSMLAQQVAGDSFEEEPPYNIAYKAALDKPFRPWYAETSRMKHDRHVQVLSRLENRVEVFVRYRFV